MGCYIPPLKRNLVPRFMKGASAQENDEWCIDHGGKDDIGAVEQRKTHRPDIAPCRIWLFIMTLMALWLISWSCWPCHLIRRLDKKELSQWGWPFLNFKMMHYFHQRDMEVDVLTLLKCQGQKMSSFIGGVTFQREQTLAYDRYDTPLLDRRGRGWYTRNLWNHDEMAWW
jgi:hypothetical protein